MPDLSAEACVFCKILHGELPASFVHRGERVAAFMDIQPVTPGHTLVIPLVHAPYLANLDPDDGSEMFRIGRQVAIALEQLGARGEIQCEGVNFFLANGEAAGQDVFHAHLHVFPRFEGDGFGLRLPPDYDQRPPRGELDLLATRIAGAL